MALVSQDNGRVILGKVHGLGDRACWFRRTAPPTAERAWAGTGGRLRSPTFIPSSAA